MNGHRGVSRRALLEQTKMGALLSFSAAFLAAGTAWIFGVGRFARS